jgi:tripartite ATP-independent transporter DctM subunit
MIEWIGDHLAIIMFLVLTFIMFVGYPVAFVLGAIGIIFGYLGILFGTYQMVQFSNLLPRVYGGAVENQVLVAVPMFIFMGTVLERSGVAEELLKCLQVLLRRVPGGLALSVVLLGTIMAATTGIVGASVVMLTLIALPVMLERGYSKELSCGVIAASGTLGILIPPSIMLVIMGDLMQISVGLLFAAAVVPGLIMSSTYLIYIMILAFMKPRLAPPLGLLEGPQNSSELIKMVVVTFAPPAFLIVLVLGSIFGGWATPTEAGGVGCAGALLLAWKAGRLNFRSMKEMVENSASTSCSMFSGTSASIPAGRRSSS